MTATPACYYSNYLCVNVSVAIDAISKKNKYHRRDRSKDSALVDLRPSQELKACLSDIGVCMKAPESGLDPKPMLKLTLSQFFDSSYAALVDAVVEHLPCPVTGAAAKVHQTYSGAKDASFIAGMVACDPNGLLMVNVTKMYHKPDCESFDAFGRVISGTLRVGDEVKVLGESYSLEDQV